MRVAFVLRPTEVHPAPDKHLKLDEDGGLDEGATGQPDEGPKPDDDHKTDEDQKPDEDQKLLTLESRLDAVETLVKGMLPIIQLEVARPLNARVDNCKKEAEEMAKHFAGLVRVLENETYGLCRKFEKFELENAG